MAEGSQVSAAVDAMIRGTLDIDHHHITNESNDFDSVVISPEPQQQREANEDEHALEWHEVIELQTFSERKAWIEEKISFLEQLPPIEVFAGLDAVRTSAEEVPGLPTRAELEIWLVEHDKIEKETEIFDSGELRKLKKFTKAATQRNLSPEDTDLIELTLTTIYELDKLLHLLRDRSDNLDLLGIRLTWEERRTAAWAEIHNVLSDIRQFLTQRARWSPTVYDAAVAEDEALHEPEPKRRNSIVSIASMASDSSNLASPGYSRSTRFKLAELLSRDAAQIASRVSSLKHSKIAGAGKALDKLIDHSRKPVPDELLDEQDKLENEGINEMEDVGKFVMNVVMQWKKADEVYVETMKDKAAAQTLLDELEDARTGHPTSRQDASFLSRANALTKRLAMREDPMSPASTFPRPSHPLFPDQSAVNEAIIHLLSTELATAVDQVRKAEQYTKEYHATLEAVKAVETACKAASELSSQLDSVIAKLELGIATDNGDGTPPDMTTEACLEGTRHAAFLTALPPMVQEMQKTNADVNNLLSSARVALLQLDRPGVDPQFKIDSSGEIERLASSQRAANELLDAVVTRASLLSRARNIWSIMGEIFGDVGSIRAEVVDAMEKQMWRQQIRSHEAPPTPESPASPLPSPTISPGSAFGRLKDLQVRLKHEVFKPLSTISTGIGEMLNDYISQTSAALSSLLDNTDKLVATWDSVKTQAATMDSIRDDVHSLQVQMEDLRVRFDSAIQEVLSGSLSGDELLLTEGGVFSELKRCQELVQSFIDDLSRRVLFVGQGPPDGVSYTTAPEGRLPLSSGFSLEVVQQASVPHLPIDFAVLDRTVRSDSNAYSIILSGAAKTLGQKADHFQLAKTAQAVDVAIASALDNIHRVVEAVASIHGSMKDTNNQPLTAHLDTLSGEIDRLLQTDGLDIARSLSPIRGLLHRMKNTQENSDIAALDGIVSSRQRALQDVEDQHNVWRENAMALQQRISHSQQAEQARLVEELRLQHERERLEAEERAGIAREEAEVAKAEEERLERERLERERLERERLEAEEQARLAEQELEERRRLEAEQIRLAQERAEDKDNTMNSGNDMDGGGTVRSDVTSTNGVYEVLEPVEESDLESSMIRDAQGPQAEDDVFGLRTQSTITATLGAHHTSDLQNRILALRKRLRSIHINEIARPNARSETSLPTDDQRRRMEKELAAVATEAGVLPSSASNDPLTNAELRSLRTEVEASVELMRRVHKLAEFATALRNCDDALSDLLEHVDSYPSPPLGALSSSHVSDPALTPEKQLSARLAFTRELISEISLLYSALSGDHRATAERDRISQTWSELEAMAMDRINGTKSRPGSVMSSGRSSRASAASTRVAPTKKSAGYSKLSLGGSDGRFLAPPMGSRRTASGSSTGHTRSSSRVSVASPSRSVSGPGPTTSSPTPYGSTFASRQRTSSVTSTASIKTPLKQSHLAGSRPRSQTGNTPRTASPAFSDASSLFVSRHGPNTSLSSTSRSSWSRAPRQSFPTIVRSPPRNKATPIVKKPYIANPKNKLDVAVGDVLNRLPVNINVEVVADTWKDQSGKYWIGDQDPKLCFCRILRSQTVMVRVGGGWSELSKFIKDHFADAFRLLPESPRLGSREEKWISSATLSQAAESLALPRPPTTPEPKSSHIPSFALSTPNGTSPKSIKTTSSPGSPLTPLQFLRRADRDSPVARPETPTRASRPAVVKTPARQPIWRP